MQRSSSRPLSSCSQPSSLSSQPLSSSSQPSSSSSQLSSSSGHIFSSSQSSSSSIQRSSDQPLSLSSQPSSSSSPPLTSFSQPSSPSGQPSSSSRKPFRSRKFLTVEQKKEVIQEVCLGLSPMDVATKYGIGKTQVYKLFKHRATLDFDKGVPNYSKLITTKSKYPDIDKAVYDWMCSIRKTIGNRRPLPVSRALIQARAILEAKLRNISNFSASDGWFYRFRWRYNICNSVRLSGEAGQVDINDATKEIDKLKLSISSGGFEKANIFNMDETGLFFKTIPSRTYLVDGESKKSARGTKYMKAKDRVTVILCANATGTCKITPVVIGKAKKPRCFRLNPPQLPYYSQKSAWNDSVLFKKWWTEIFLQEIRAWTSSPVALLMDGFSGHERECQDPIGQVTVFYFPPNVTSIFQPLDQGIISAFKTKYKGYVLEKLVGTVDSFAELQVLGKQYPDGCAGLDYGNPPHISDAICIIKHCWDSITEEAISACWKHSNCLPFTDAQPISDYTDLSAIEEELLSHMQTLLPSAASIFGLDKSLRNVQLQVLDAWLHIEECEIFGTSDDLEDDEIEETPDGFDAVSVQNVGSTYIIMSWDLPTDSNGILINFSLYCNGALAGVLPLTVISYNTTGLLPFTLYMYITLSVGQVLQSRPQALHSSWNVVLGVISAAASLPSHVHHEDSPPGGPPDPALDTNDIVISLFINKIINPDKSFGSSMSTPLNMPRPYTVIP
ncbi:hypothetical protein EMCRGX_G010257 [Ephydatia muelleri]